MQGLKCWQPIHSASRSLSHCLSHGYCRKKEQLGHCGKNEQLWQLSQKGTTHYRKKNRLALPQKRTIHCPKNKYVPIPTANVPSPPKWACLPKRALRNTPRRDGLLSGP